MMVEGPKGSDPLAVISLGILFIFRIIFPKGTNKNNIFCQRSEEITARLGLLCTMALISSRDRLNPGLMGPPVEFWLLP